MEDTCCATQSSPKESQLAMVLIIRVSRQLPACCVVEDVKSVAAWAGRRKRVENLWRCCATKVKGQQLTSQGGQTAPARYAQCTLPLRRSNLRDPSDGGDRAHVPRINQAALHSRTSASLPVSCLCDALCLCNRRCGRVQVLPQCCSATDRRRRQAACYHRRHFCRAVRASHHAYV